MIGWQLGRKLVPLEGYRDRRAFTSARRVRRDERGSPAVAQIVDERLALALGLGGGGDVQPWRARREGAGNTPREVFGFIPAQTGHHGHAHVEPFAARGLHEGLQLRVLEYLTHRVSAGD